MIYVTRDMEDNAQESCARDRRSTDPSMLLVPQLPANSFWDRGVLSPTALMEAVFPYYEEDGNTDMSNLHHFTQLARGGQLLLPGECSLRDAVVNAAPILDYLKL